MHDLDGIHGVGKTVTLPPVRMENAKIVILFSKLKLAHYCHLPDPPLSQRMNFRSDLIVQFLGASRR